MPSSPDDPGAERKPTMLDRRRFLVAGLGLAAAPLLNGVGVGAETDQRVGRADRRAQSARAYGTTAATSPLGPLQILRRAVAPNDVLLDVLYCGIRHSDIHQARDEWTAMPTQYPCVPGHEIVGRVEAVGDAVTRFRVGDVGGVGCMVDSCGTCENCLADGRRTSLRRATFTYNSPVPPGGHTLGGYSDRLAVPDRSIIRIPPAVDFAAPAPWLCAGI